MNMLAEVATSPLPAPTGTQLLVWMGCAAAALGGFAFVLMIYNQLSEAKRNLTGNKEGQVPQPLTVKMASRFVSEEECRKRYKELCDALADDRRAGISSRNKLYEEIRRVNGEMEKKMDSVRQEVSDHTESVRKELGGQIANLPAQLVAILRNTGAIGE
jgi:hypothetical protein